jgi:hypothetical protein
MQELLLKEVKKMHKPCIETNPKLWHVFVIWFTKWNYKKIDPCDWTENDCNQTIDKWYATVLDNLGIEMEDIK